MQGLVMSADAKREYDLKPKFQVGLITSPLGINLSHYIYNRLVNLKIIFDIAPEKLKTYDKDTSKVNSAKYDDIIANKKISGYVLKSSSADLLWDNLPTFDAPSEVKARSKTTKNGRPDQKSIQAAGSNATLAWE